VDVQPPIDTEARPHGTTASRTVQHGVVGAAVVPDVWIGAVDFRQAVVDVDVRCGLDVHQACDTQGCAAVAISPNLGHISGWARLALSSPRFVVSQALMPLGLPVSADSCRSAVDTLARQGEPVGLYGEDGSELWCVGGDRRLCDLALVDAGLASPGFATADEVRALRFGR
jgi:hypothetical protein